MSELYPSSYQIQPMKYHNKLVDSKVEDAIKSGEWCFQEKKDGALYMLEHIDKEHNYLFARTVSKKTGELVEKSANVPHIIEWANNWLPDGTVLLGEIYIPGGKSNDVTKIMGALPVKAISRQFDSDEFGGPVHFYVFDCLVYKGENITDKPYIYRFCDTVQSEMFDCFYFTTQDTPISPYVSVAETFYPIVNEEQDNVEEKLKEIFAAGGEGVVFKNLYAPYEPNKRPMTNFKIKEHIDTVDLICTDLLNPEYYYTGKEADTWEYTDDEGKLITKAAYYHWKNRIQLGAYDDNGNLVTIGTVASGITDKLCEEFAANPNNFIGQVVECSCMSLDKKEKTLRHPVFLRFRDDKPATDCKISEIF